MLPDGIEQNFPLARLTTVRTGGPADYFARPESQDELVAPAGLGKRDRRPGRSDRLGIEPPGSG